MEKKIFHKTPIIGELYVNGFINGVKLENVAFEKDKKLLENVFIHQLQVVNDLLVQNINNMSLDYLLQNRIRLNGPSQEIYGALTFQKLEIFGLNFIPTINGINSNSFVYLMYPETQMISGKKSIKNSLYINGPMHCMRLNNIELSETITSNAKLDLHENLKNLNVKKLIVHSGIVITEHIDNQPINSITQIRPKTLNNLLPNVPYLRNYIQSTSELLQSKPVTKRFLYLDYATDMEIVYKSDDIDSIQGHLQLIVDSNNECPEQLDIKVTNAGKIFIRKRTVEHLTLCADPRMQLNLKLAVKNCVFENNVLISWINANKTSEIQYNMHGQIKSKLYCFNVNDKQFVGFLKAENEHLHTFDIIYLTKGNQWSLKDVLDIQDATNAKIITTNSYTLLVVTSKKGVEFFNLNKLDEKFELLEIITGSYNLISDLVSVGDDKMIVLALKNSKSITIFKLIEDNKDGPEIQFFQNLRFEGRVKSLTAFAMNGESLIKEVHFDVTTIFNIEDEKKHPDKLFKCDFGETFKSQHTLRIHKNIHTNKFVCDICNKAFGNNTLIRKHKLLKHNENNQKQRENLKNTYTCSDCCKTFSAKVSLRLHKNTHTDKFRCNIKDCGKGFPNNSRLYLHLKSVHKIILSELETDKSEQKEILKKNKGKVKITEIKGIKEKFFICEICGRSYSSYPAYYIHKKNHEPANFECNNCGKKFHRKTILKKHLLTQHMQSETPEFSCTLCDKHFYNTYSLLSHQHVHQETNYQSNPKNFQCTTCLLTFNSKLALKSHETIHSVKRTYKCNFCSKDFSRKCYLAAHEITHTKPYLCGIKGCGSRFTNVETWNEHRKIHNTEDYNDFIQGDYEILVEATTDKSEDDNYYFIQ
uniref:CSON009626 protein n=1 Tax=Culicoides sonorensis TaxID=179676 RepID=A0A336LDQ3_CULSO